MYRLLIPLVLASLVALNLSGCGVLNGEIYLGTRRIDHYEQTQEMKEKPVYCHFFSCPTQEVSK